MSEPKPEYLCPPAIPVSHRVMAEITVRSPERRKSVLDTLSTLITIRDLVLPVDAEDRSNVAVVARVQELVDRERMDEDDHR